MPDVLLIRITTGTVTLELHGPAAPTGFVPPGVVPAGRLDVSSTDGPPEVFIRTEDGVLDLWHGGQRGPALYEETPYNLRVKSRLPGGTPPTLISRDPLLLDRIVCYEGDLMCVGPINFRSQIGLSTLEVRAGHETMHVTWQVFPTKLDYEHDYEFILSDVARVARALALEYLRATYRTGAAKPADEVTELEWLILLRNQIDALQRAVFYINDHPHRALVRQVRTTRVDTIRRTDSSVRRAVLRGSGRGPWLDLPGIGQVRSLLDSAHPQETLDVAEHRWLRLNLRRVRERLADLQRSLRDEADAYLATGRELPKRLMAERSEVARFAEVVMRLLRLPVIAAAPGPPPAGFASLTLLSAPGYGEAYKAIMVLRLGLNIVGDLFDLSVKDVYALYETWCFIELVRLVAEKSSGKPDLTDLLQVEESGIRVRLRRGNRASIQCVSARYTVIVSYNPEYPGLTGDQRPDIVLRFQHEGWPELIVVFDAKYRVDGSQSYVRRFGLPGPPQEAINALHRYRDAIVISNGRGYERPVVRGAALYPLNAVDSQGFPESSLAKGLEVLGIGAIPFLPGGTEYVETWLQYLIAMSPYDLAEAGPPFAGVREKRLRETARIEEALSSLTHST